MFPIFYSIAMLIILPASFIISLWKAPFKSKLEWLLDLLVTTALIVWLFQAGNWSWVGYYVRFLWLALLIVTIIYSWKKVSNLPFTIKYSVNQKFSIGIYIILILIFGTYNALVLKSYTVAEKGIELSFPLKNGTYYVGQGGNQVLMNYHQAYPGQKYALDILKLNTFGTRASGLYPEELKNYQIYADILYSPCNGKVVDIQNALPDLPPPKSNPENPAGNHVALACENYDATIILAHMQKGSVAVAKGEKVTTGQILGKVGNSGNTSEPHLHIHAEKDGKGVPITFNDRFLVRNSLVR
ncbi:M23 family metallopeptidase [Lysinibacillus sp. Ag94]|uniref:M23 family metallopeptidase n=1 Tax=Lysinibacillus sp. Ag94 TaxID=2936682 RepID=UPI0020101E61|nr:M23 family metallopeptidase [Lysinibacillus sp. Ag94]UPW85064.1 M23 family metallopeptidase [Lysinibacillus sp. Ag94]